MYIHVYVYILTIIIIIIMIITNNILCYKMKAGREGSQKNKVGKRDSILHHLLETISETASVLELRQKLLYTTPSGWWWCIESVFRKVGTPDPNCSPR